MKKIKSVKKKRIKKILEEYTEVFVFISLILIVIALIYIQRPLVGRAYTVIESEHISAKINLPEEIYAGEEFTVTIDLDINNISNGVLVSVDFPNELEINSVIPTNAMITKNKIVWVLAPYDNNLSFKIISNISGDYELMINFGTYDNNDQITEENSAIVLLNVVEKPECNVNMDCDDNNVCTSNSCVNSECVYDGITDCCLNNSECNDHNTCTTDYCEDSICQNIPIDCDDNNECTADTCVYGGKCVHDKIESCCFDDSDCDDGKACTTDSCVNQVCQYEDIYCGLGRLCMDDPESFEGYRCVP